jgi:hypothetical protein
LTRFSGPCHRGSMANPISGRNVETQRDMPTLAFRAAFSPGSANPEKRTVELVFTTGARVLRGFWERYYEELSLDPKHVRMGRLNNGAPLLDSHMAWGGTRTVLGVVESAKLEGDKGTAVVRFAKAEDDPEADKVFRKVLDGILQNVSVGYMTHRLEKIEDGDEKIPVYRATDWEPFELSVVPVGADDGAGFRSHQEHQTHPCVFVTREERSMPEPVIPATPPAPAIQPTDTEAATRAATEAATRDERERIAAIRDLVARHQAGAELERRLVDGGTTIAEARAAVLDAIATRAAATPTNQHTSLEAGEDLKRSSMRSGMVNALLHRAAPHLVKLEDVGREYRAMSLMRMAEESLGSAGVKTRHLSPLELAGAALGLGVRSQHATSDFPLILADVANKTLRRAYEEAPQTFMCCSRRTTLPDFKPVKRNQLGEAPQLKKVVEGGEFTRGTLGEGREQYQLATYGRVVAITRQAIVNDDMDAFSRLPALFGRSARDLESDIVWEQITGNPQMGDGVTLFHANHGNLAGAPAAIAIASIGLGRAAMRSQKGVDKKQFINVQPRTLCVPTALETTADQFVSQNMLANAAGSVNPFAGRLVVVAEPRLDAASATAWYLCADPGQIDMVEYAYLLGEEGPTLESRVGFDVDGVELKCRHDFAAKVIDHRGFYKNAGV